jgi:predicted phage terminase large subunit-like protein
MLAIESLPLPVLRAVLSDLGPPRWREIARKEQQLPEGTWRTWLVLAGRGFGKSRTGAEAITEWVEAGKARKVMIAAQTAADARDVSVDAIRTRIIDFDANGKPIHGLRPGVEYEPSKRRVTWANGATGTTFSAEDPDSFRGYQGDSAWLDEVAAWKFPESFDQLQYGLRQGHARQIVTTTPRPVRIIRELLADPTTSITRGRTEDNAKNLSDTALAYLRARYEGTRLGRQELEGELLDDVPGALWSRALIVRKSLPIHWDGVANVPDMNRIVVSIDPAVTSGEDSDETGIVVAGLDNDGKAYVIEDLSGRFAPDEWAKRAIRAYHDHQADRIVAEVNNGGDLIESMLRLYDPNVPVSKVHAKVGKHTRAEPVAALYEQGRVYHVAGFPTLEDQMCAFTGNPGEQSPDRMDALVWALTELMLTGAYSGDSFSMVA